MIGLVRRFPVTTTYILALLVGGLLTAVGGGAAALVTAAASTGYEEVLRDARWWTPLTAVLFTQNPALLFLVLPLAALCLGFAERRMPNQCAGTS